MKRILVKRILSPLLAAVMVTAIALPAFAEEDPLSLLKQLSQQEQTGTRTDTGLTTLDSSSAIVPDAAAISMDVDLEDGATHEERLANYIGKLEASGATDFDTSARLGLAYQMAANHAKARDALEKAIAAEPGAQALYDALAKSWVNLEAGIKVYVNGKLITFDSQPTIVSGRTLVPIRAVAEALGAKLDWNQETSTVTITRGSTKVEVTKDSLIGRVNGQEVKLDVAATIIGNRMLLPLRFVSESMGTQVDPHYSGVAGSMVISIIDK